jgi:hypothetical protein
MEILSVYGSVQISCPGIGQTDQRLVCHWLGMAAMFRSRVKFWGVGEKMLFTVQVSTNWFRQINYFGSELKQSIDNRWGHIIIDSANIK